MAIKRPPNVCQSIDLICSALLARAEGLLSDEIIFKIIIDFPSEPIDNPAPTWDNKDVETANGNHATGRNLGPNK